MCDRRELTLKRDTLVPLPLVPGYKNNRPQIIFLKKNMSLRMSQWGRERWKPGARGETCLLGRGFTHPTTL